MSDDIVRIISTDATGTLATLEDHPNGASICIHELGIKFFIPFSEARSLGTPEGLRAASKLVTQCKNAAPAMGVSAAVFEYRAALRNISRAENKPIVDALGVTTSSEAEPPKIAEFLLTALATTRAAEAMIGDLNERFADECKELGQHRAVRLYWARTLRSLLPLLRRAIGKAVKWGVMIDMLRRHL